MGLAAQDLDVMAVPGQRPRQIARVLVAARARELEAMKDSEPVVRFQRLWNECTGQPLARLRQRDADCARDPVAV